MSQLHPIQISHPRPGRYVAPTTVADVAAVLAAAAPGTARLVAGATDLMVEIARGSRSGVELLVDVSAVHDVEPITVADGLVRIGLTATHRQVVMDPRMTALALPLAQACAEIGSPQLRNRATVVGNVVTASPANDTLSALSALGASATVVSVRGTRTVPLEALVTGFRTTSLAADELVTELTFPTLGPRRRGIFVKLGNRSAQAISVVHLAAVVSFDDDGVTVREARVALGSVAATVRCSPAIAAALEGDRKSVV